MNNANACFYLSGMHISGVESSADNTIETEDTDKKSSTDKTKVKFPSTSVSKMDLVVVKDMQKAFTFAYKACELKNMYACANLSQMFARGDGTEKDDEKAAKFKKMALEMQDEIKNNKSQMVFQQTA